MTPTLPKTLRCSACGINYPFEGRFTTCRGCGGPTSAFLGDEAHGDWEERVRDVRRLQEGLVVDTREREREVAWRASQLLEAGYDPESAEILAGLTGDVDLELARTLPTKGCDPALAYEILV